MPVLQLHEQKIKAGLVYNFLKSTSWPEQAKGNRLHVCLYGEDSFGGHLMPLAGRTAQQKTIEIQIVSTPGTARNCDLIFIHNSYEEKLPRLLNGLKDKHILTVSDIPGFAAQGGMVEISRYGDKLHLRINKNALSAAGLSIEDRLLRLAEK